MGKVGHSSMQRYHQTQLHELLRDGFIAIEAEQEVHVHFPNSKT